jgi:hypothetical protein
MIDVPQTIAALERVARIEQMVNVSLLPAHVQEMMRADCAILRALSAALGQATKVKPNEVMCFTCHALVISIDTTSADGEAK